jgi:hypothetical protein
MWMLVFQVIMPCGLVGRYNVLKEHTASVFSPEDEDDMFFQNIGIYLQVHIASQPRKPTFTNIITFHLLFQLL